MLSLKANDIFDGNYLLLERLGQGGFAEVWKVKNLNAELVQALKVYIGLDQSGSQVFRKEYARFYELNHPNLLTASNFGVYEDRPYLVMPYCPGGTALERAGQVDEKELARMLRDLSAGLMYLHELSSPVIHQDVKPDNFLINARGDYMLSDFGISTELRRTLVKSIPAGRATEQLHSAGHTPPAYRAPEFYDKDRKGNGAIIASDIWALGASLYEIATGNLPFHDLGGLSQMNGAPIPNLSAPFSVGFNQLLHRCMAEKPWERPSARDLNEQASEFLKVGSWWEEVVPVSPLVPDVEESESAPVQTETSNHSFVGIILGILLLAISIYFGFKDQFDERFSGSGNSSTSPSNYQAEVYQSPPDPDPIKEPAPPPPAVTSSREQSSTSSSRDTKPTKTEPRESNKAKSDVKTTNRIPDPIQKLQKDMVRVEGGTFIMGCKDGRDKDCYENEKPTRRVQLYGFSIGKYEVTQAQWRAVMGDTHSNNMGCDNCPVEEVSWNDAQEFIQKLNVLTGQRYRLPTEAEWEYAARGGNKSKGYLYSGSNSIDEVAWYESNYKKGNTLGRKKTTRPVGGKKANELGLYDMSGNVYEWVQDWYGTYPFKDEENPYGPESASYRVYHGGGWNSSAQGCRVARRSYNATTGSGHNLGFRLAL